MNAPVSLPHGLPLSSRHADLTALGFEPTGSHYRCPGYLLRADQGWITLRAEASADPDLGAIGRPGFWRVLPGEGAGGRVFELPAFVLEPDEDDELLLESHPLEQSLNWALQTAETEAALPPWDPPPKTVIESWLPKGGLTVLTGGSVVQGELITAPGRLALRFPLHASLPAQLPETRRAWLLAVLRDAQRLNWLARLGLTEDADVQTVIAEIDLSYAPPAVCERLLLVSLESLRWVAAQLTETVAYLADPAAVAGALQSPPE